MLPAMSISHSSPRDLPMLKDPFDRMITATALRLRVPLITADRAIAEAGVVRVIW